LGYARSAQSSVIDGLRARFEKADIATSPGDVRFAPES